MNLLLLRDTWTPTSTTGRLYANNDFFCYTLEDLDRGLDARLSSPAVIAAAKVAGATAIPTGHYRLDYTASVRFGRPMPLVVGVPGFRGIRIHAGNTAADTAGCPLVGMARGPDVVTRSQRAFAWLDPRIRDAVAAGSAWLDVQ